MSCVCVCPYYAWHGQWRHLHDSNIIGHVCVSRGYFWRRIWQAKVAETLCKIKVNSIIIYIITRRRKVYRQLRVCTDAHQQDEEHYWTIGPLLSAAKLWRWCGCIWFDIFVRRIRTRAIELQCIDLTQSTRSYSIFECQTIKFRWYKLFVP